MSSRGLPPRHPQPQASAMASIYPTAIVLGRNHNPPSPPLENQDSGPPPRLPRMRICTKVYKRGALGRSIDIARYSGYEELKQDLVRRFGIEGQLEGRQGIGWKLVYVDHENDVLLVGNDPWEEFLMCVHSIKILSPQEFQQTSSGGDFGE